MIPNGDAEEQGMENESSLWSAREAMVRDQIARRGIRDPRLLDVMLRVPRHRFVPPPLIDRAYDDGPLAIGEGQTISQPYIVAAMTELLDLHGTENVLEIGTGSGYQAAVLAELARSVHTVERYPYLAQRASAILHELGYMNIFVHVADGSLGWQPAAPYQAILVTAAAPDIPQPLIDQMDEGARLVIPIGNRYGQDLERWRKSSGKMVRENIFPVAFVPLRGQHGWKTEEWEEKID
jgi:protein-L-isoaspartate(D-aspartate) O-methyltransferase